MSLRIRKLYADLVTDDGAVCVVYTLALEAAGLRRTYAGLEYYDPHGGRHVLRAVRPPADPDGKLCDDAWEMELALPGGRFTLRHEIQHGAWVPDGAPPCPGLRWSVAIARAAAVARWETHGTARELVGPGYVDRVELTRVPRKIGLRSLEWGRVHLPEATLVFARVGSGTASPWARAAAWKDGAGPLLYEALRLRHGRNGIFAVRLGERGPEAARAVLAPKRVLHRGSAMDPARFPGLLQRFAWQLLAGPTFETRTLCTALPLRGGKDAVYSALYEVVTFGDRPPRRRPAG